MLMRGSAVDKNHNST